MGIFYFRNKISFKSKKLVGKKKELAPIISNFLFHNPSAPLHEQKEYVELKIKMRDDLKDKSFRNILTEILVNLQKDVAGETRKRLNELYFDLNLQQDAYEKLKSKRWQLISKGILELTQMQIYDAYPFITKFLNDKRRTIRKQAEIATVSLREEGITHFLDTTRFTISEWQQLKLMETMRNIQHFRPPSFRAWLISSNRDVVLFSLRLIKHYNQNDAISSIVELLKHKDNRIKAEAIKCIKEFCVIKAIPTMKAIYAKSNESVRLEILDAISTLGNEEDLDFLMKVYEKESNFIIQNKAAMSINDIAPDTVLPTKDIISEQKLALEKEESVFGGETELKNAVREIADSNTETVEEVFVDDKLEEIEVFEVSPDTISLPNQTEDPKSLPQDESSKEKFEIGPLPKELDQSLNAEIGLISDDKDITDKEYPNQDFGKVYFDMEHEEKNRFVETMQDTASEDDAPLLEEIMEEEPDSELRFQIFKILKSLGKKPDVIAIEVKEEEQQIYSGKPAESIFYELYEYASDNDSKMILINEMAEVGDEREIPFLQELIDSPDAFIRKKAGESIKNIVSRMGLDTTNIESKEIDDSNGFQEETAIEGDVITKDEEEGLLPLDLCFLYDEFDIAPSNEEKSDLNFGLAEEFYVDQEKRITPNKQ